MREDVLKEEEPTIHTVLSLINEFNQKIHDGAKHGEDDYFVQAGDDLLYAPLNYLKKKCPSLKSEADLLKLGFFFGPQDLHTESQFVLWYEKRFQRPLTPSIQKKAQFLFPAIQEEILHPLQVINQQFELLKKQRILTNSKDLPTQFGEWLTKSIFGLKHRKSMSQQRGFDFEWQDKKVEVFVYWKLKSQTQSSLKGLKIKKTDLHLYDICILVYLTPDFLIKDLCFLDSSYIQRKFASKGHSLFIQEEEIQMYFFTRSSKHYDKIINEKTLLTFASSSFLSKYPVQR
jgi:hypothetical protein